ncbi:hypothetical protein [Paraburkholderia sp. J11-2]|uniref:hypothetical protein n=1 Tax=Paraburkholderia sp. J11-2 TaxID=2805431 RepID=UPI002AB7E3C1|nr:hypothetical protein [Paraburkholderia sp. J11-2]
MKEFIESTRAVHLILVAVCAAIIVFCCSPRDSEKYYEAYEEANYIKLRNLDLYGSDIIEYQKKTMVSIAKQYVEEKSASNITLPISPNFWVVAPFGSMWPESTTPLSYYRDYVNSGISPPGGVAPPAKVFVEALRKLAAPERTVEAPRCFDAVTKRSYMCPTLQHGVVLQSAEVTDVGGTFLDTSRPLNFVNFPRISNARWSLALHFETPQSKRQDIVVELDNAGLGKACLCHFSVGAPPFRKWFFDQAESDSALTALRKQSPTIWRRIDMWLWEKTGEMWFSSPRTPWPGSLRLFVDSFDSAFPHLGRVSDEISGQTVDAATSYLRDKAAKAEETITVLGQTLEKSTLSITAPFAVLLVCLYLLSNIRMMLRALTSNKDPNALVYPWVGLHSDALSSILSFISIGVLPIGSTILLLLTLRGTSAVAYLVGILIVLCIAITSGASILLLRELHRVSTVIVEPIQPTD